MTLTRRNKMLMSNGQLAYGYCPHCTVTHVTGEHPHEDESYTQYHERMESLRNRLIRDQIADAGDHRDFHDELDALEPRVVSCGCCTNGCICHNHMDIPRGQRPQKCAIHSGTGENRYLQA